MRTPAPEVVLAEFHRQKSLLAAAGALLHNEGRLEGRLDGAEKRGSKENTDSNGAVEVGAEGGVTSRIPKLLRGMGQMRVVVVVGACMLLHVVLHRADQRGQGRLPQNVMTQRAQSCVRHQPE